MISIGTTIPVNVRDWGSLMELTCILELIQQRKQKCEAEHVVRLLQGKNLTYPIYYDMEADMLNQLSSTQIGNIAKSIFEYDGILWI